MFAWETLLKIPFIKAQNIQVPTFLFTLYYTFLSWWRHQIKTISALLTLCAGNSLVTGEFRSQRPVRQSFDIFFDLRLCKLTIEWPVILDAIALIMTSL